MNCIAFKPNKLFPEYGSWCAMRRRCNNPNSRGYSNYGGRGISVCKRWQSFRNFLADMGPRPSDSHAIDREEKNGNYEPSNCRWADQKTQQRNRRNNCVITIDGRRMTAIEASEIYGVPHARLLGRLRLGWSDEKAVFAPKSNRGRKPKLATH